MRRSTPCRLSLTSQPPTLEDLFLRHYGAHLEPHDHTGLPDVDGPRDRAGS